MDVKDAVAAAKSYVSDLYTGEDIEHIGLEEVEFEERDDTWRITIGFSRPWERDNPPEPHPLATFLPNPQAPSPFRRAYKVLRVRDEDGRVESLRDRFPPDGSQ